MGISFFWELVVLVVSGAVGEHLLERNTFHLDLDSGQLLGVTC